MRRGDLPEEHAEDLLPIPSPPPSHRFRLIPEGDAHEGRETCPERVGGGLCAMVSGGESPITIRQIDRGPRSPRMLNLIRTWAVLPRLRRFRRWQTMRNKMRARRSSYPISHLHRDVTRHNPYNDSGSRGENGSEHHREIYRSGQPIHTPGGLREAQLHSRQVADHLDHRGEDQLVRGATTGRPACGMR